MMPDTVTDEDGQAVHEQCYVQQVLALLDTTQKRQWNNESETDTPRGEARQPYRTREQDSAKAFTDSLKTGRTNQNTIPKKAAE
jgi:hypothetical protein